MTDSPLVSIVIPVYNGAAFVERALDSALAQRGARVEVVVVDDGSTDGGGALLDARAAADDRIRVIHQPNAGLSAARNAGIAHATGAFVSFLDADDWLLEHKLEHQLAAFASHPEADLVYSDYEQVREEDGSVTAVPRGVPPRPFPELLVYRNWFAPMVPLLRRALVERVGTFDETFRAAEDWDYWYRCAQAGAFAYAPGVVARYRLHGGQMHRDHERMNTARLQFARKHFADDPERMRRFLSYFHLDDARYYKGRGRWLAVGTHLARFAWMTRTPAEARFVWELP